ncbi:hypothetical protein DRH14_02525 [Candidatus Shapirobacteria bacterium]|nr:MAG: hypothetical protein DRH14_02525 [Candidatus Shapirobacteria bacterium]
MKKKKLTPEHIDAIKKRFFDKWSGPKRCEYVRDLILRSVREPKSLGELMRKYPLFSQLVSGAMEALKDNQEEECRLGLIILGFFWACEEIFEEMKLEAEWDD